jgi:hypothetical protein
MMAKIKLEHKHRWHIDLVPEGMTLRCLDFKCKHVMSIGELERYINAAESFKLQDAIQVLWNLEHAAGVAVGPEYEALEDYISELEP